MRLLRLELDNFRNYSHLVIDFTEPRTILIGENGVGKSTIFDAISWVILGRCRGVDGKGAGQKDLIRLGADTMRVTLTTDALGIVTRSISRAGSATASMPTDVMLGKLNVTDGMLAAVLSGQTFFGMHHADAKALLMQLLDVRIQKADLPGVDLPDTVDAVDLPTLESLYDIAFKDRAALKAQLAAVHVPPAPKVVDIDTGGATLPQLKADLTAQQTALQTVTRAISAAEHDVQQLTTKHANADRLAASIDRLNGNLQTHDGMLVQHQGEAATADAALAALDATAAEPVSTLQMQLSEQATLIDKIERHTSTIIPTDAIPKTKKAARAVKDVAVSQPHVCVLGGGIPCLTAASEFIGAVSQLRATQKTLEGRIRAGNERTRQLAALQQAKKDADRHVAYHQNQVTDLQAQVAEAERAQTDLPQLADALQEASLNLTVLRRNADEIRTTTKRLTDRLTERAGYDRDVQAHQDGTRRQADLKAQVEAAEVVVALLGPKGIRATALQAALDDFHQAINAALAPFLFEVAITVEPWKVEINRADDPGWLRFSMLSTGQQLWTAVAFQITLALVSGLDFCVIDTVENVVGTNRAMLTQLVMKAPVGQVLVAMAKGDDDDAPASDSLQVLRAELIGQAAVA